MTSLREQLIETIREDGLSGHPVGIIDTMLSVVQPELDRLKHERDEARGISDADTRQLAEIDGRIEQLRQALAAALGLDPDAVWPDLINEAGNQHRTLIRLDRTLSNSKRNREKRT